MRASKPGFHEDIGITQPEIGRVSDRVGSGLRVPLGWNRGITLPISRELSTRAPKGPAQFQQTSHPLPAVGPFGGIGGPRVGRQSGLPLSEVAGGKHLMPAEPTAPAKPPARPVNPGRATQHSFPGFRADQAAAAPPKPGSQSKTAWKANVPPIILLDSLPTTVRIDS